MRRVPDLIDVWWDSGCMPFAQWHAPFENEDLFDQRFPADFICEALDQTRGWFYSLLAVSVLLFGEASYRTCLCLGLILDPEGQKMSKSKGNVVVPWDVLERARRGRLPLVLLHLEAALGRLPLLARDGRRVGAPVPQAALEHVRASTSSTRTSRRPRRRLGEPIWTGGSGRGLSATTQRVIERMDDYDTTFAGRAIAEFIDDLSNWYVRLSRRRFWRGDDRPPSGRSATACSMSRSCSRRSRRSSPMRSTTTSMDRSRRSTSVSFRSPACGTKASNGGCRWCATLLSSDELRAATRR